MVRELSGLTVDSLCKNLAWLVVTRRASKNTKLSKLGGGCLLGTIWYYALITIVSLFTGLEYWTDFLPCSCVSSWGAPTLAGTSMFIKYKNSAHTKFEVKHDEDMGMGHL